MNISYLVLYTILTLIIPRDTVHGRCIIIIIIAVHPSKNL